MQLHRRSPGDTRLSSYITLDASTWSVNSPDFDIFLVCSALQCSVQDSLVWSGDQPILEWSVYYLWSVVCVTSCSIKVAHGFPLE